MDRYHLEDFVLKVVGIGSVGTRCFIGLFFDEDDPPLILQFKQADRPSKPRRGNYTYDNQGQHVVMGQRLIQASSSDIFLRWLRGQRGYDYCVCQLRDMKMSTPVQDVTPAQLKRYGGVCGWALARAHAKSGDATTISGYLGKYDTFDEAIGA